MKKIRALGYMEARMHYMHSYLRGTTQGCLVLRINGELDQECFTNAVNRAVSHLPLLQCVIQENNNIPFFLKQSLKIHLSFLMGTYWIING